MAWLKTKRPWYADGLAFGCTGCGRCCSGPEEGYVWVSPEEIRLAGGALKISPEEFRRLYTRQVGSRTSLIEQAGLDCTFLRASPEGGKRCMIYAARPIQCRTWPFWKMNLSNPRAWSEAGQKCPGINCDPLFSLSHIEDERTRTGG